MTDTGTTSVLPEDTMSFTPVDTATGTEDNEPEHWLYLLQAGRWSLSPSGAYQNLTGVMNLEEWVDERPVLETGLPTDDTATPESCHVVYALVGTVVEEHGCVGCEFVFDIEFTVTDGDTGPCLDPDTPQDGGSWRMGYDDVAGQILLNYQGSGIYIPWWTATKAGDLVDFEWEAQVGIEQEEEDE